MPFYVLGGMCLKVWHTKASVEAHLRNNYLLLWICEYFQLEKKWLLKLAGIRPRIEESSSNPINLV